MKSKYRIGEVAKMFSISRPTLLYYDEINLANPSIIEDNDYRYYTYEDIERLELILLLKESGLKLSKIKEFLAAPSHQEATSIFEAQKKEIHQQIQKMQKTEMILKKRIDYIHEFTDFEFYADIRVVELESYIGCVQVINLDDLEPFSFALRNLKDILDKHPNTYGSMTSKYRVVLPKESILNGDFYEFSSVMDILPTAIDETCLTQFPSSYYVTCLHHGAYHFVHNAFERMMEFINENSYEVAGDAIITPIHDVWASTSDKEYLTEIQIPISRS